MKNKNTKRMLKIYSLALATSLIFSTCKEGVSRHTDTDNIHEYSWSGGVLSEEELVNMKKDGKGAYRKKGRKL